MFNSKKEIISILKTVESGTSFCVSGSLPMLLPGLTIEGLGELSLPINDTIYQELLKFSTQAPFGKGSKTITDTSVRSSQELDAAKISFKNPAWEKVVNEIVGMVKKEFALEGKNIHASLYKLLIYKEGDFFLPHKDSEKEKGMFGTLVIGLPSMHSGGNLSVKFDHQVKEVSFSEALEEYQLPYAAFYADCTHELTKIQSGYRLCLVYNLLQLNEPIVKTNPAHTHQLLQLAKVFQSSEIQSRKKPLVILLDHQYTPENFSEKHLKRRDNAKAETIINACEKAGCYAKLALLTCYQDGELIADFGDGYYYDNDFENAEMGEIFDEYIEIAHWSPNGIPHLGHCSIDPEEIITDATLKNDDPIETEEEGYTGNAGMSMQYWYHYGAVVVWPKSQHVEILKDKDIRAAANWLTYCLINWEEAYRKDCKSLLLNIREKSRYTDDVHVKDQDLSILVDVFLKLDDYQFTAQHENILFLQRCFAKIQQASWIKFLKTYPSLFDEISTLVGNSKQIEKVNHLISLFHQLSKKSQKWFAAVALRQIKKLPNYLHFKDIYLTKNSSTTKTMMMNILHLSSYFEENEFSSQLLHAIGDANYITRHYVNSVLVSTLLTAAEVPNSVFVVELVKFCKEDLSRRTLQKPQPPKDWSRKVPTNRSYASNWAILKEFLESPTQQVFDYSIKQAKRIEMENAINSEHIDLSFITIAKGSPHTLRITKTQKTYEKQLKKWHEDKELLIQLNHNYL